MRGNVCERMRSRENVHEAMYAREHLQRAMGEGINVRLRTLAKSDRGENSRKQMIVRGDLQGHRSSSTGELHVVEFVRCIILIPNTHG